MKHNDTLTLREDNDLILSKSAAQIQSLSLANTFVLLKYLITGLFNS